MGSTSRYRKKRQMRRRIRFELRLGGRRHRIVPSRIEELIAACPLPWSPKPGAKIVLDLGTVKEIAEVEVNGKTVGGFCGSRRFAWM